MFAKFSVENKIVEGLKALDCSDASFVAICKANGVPISAGVFSQVLNGKSKTPGFESTLGHRMLDILKEMQSLQDDFVVPLRTSDGTVVTHDASGGKIESVPVWVDWGKSAQVSAALCYRRMRSIASELHDEELVKVTEGWIDQTIETL